MSYKVQTRSSDARAYRLFSEYETLEEAMAVAKRLEANTELQVIVDLPSGSSWLSSKANPLNLV